MKSQKTFNYELKSGKKVEVIVTRIYGNEMVKINADGHICEFEKFKNEFTIEVSAPELNVKGSGYLSTRDQNQNHYQVIVVGNQLMVMPDDLAEQVIAATKEILTEELDPVAVKIVERVKKAIESNNVLPQNEINKLKNKYNNDFNEGGEGFNPYDYYMSQEEVSDVKTKYSTYF